MARLSSTLFASPSKYPSIEPPRLHQPQLSIKVSVAPLWRSGHLDPLALHPHKGGWLVASLLRSDHLGSTDAAQESGSVPLALP